MKKNAVLFSILALSFIVGLMACSSSSKYVAPPTPLAYSYVTSKVWTIQSVIAINSTTGATNTYTSPDSLGGSRLAFGLATDQYGRAYWGYMFSDKNNSTWVGPKNDSTVFRYNSGAWNFDSTWRANAQINLNAIPDSLLFQAGVFNGGYLSNLQGPIFRSMINKQLFDSTHLSFTYLDSTWVNPAGGKYMVTKIVNLVPATN